MPESDLCRQLTRSGSCPPGPGPSALLACVLHGYACSGARRTGSIRTTWPPDLSAPFINSLLVVGRPQHDSKWVACKPEPLTQAVVQVAAVAEVQEVDVVHEKHDG